MIAARPGATWFEYAFDSVARPCPAIQHRIYECQVWARDLQFSILDFGLV
jgi:hypothetical protein